MTVVDAVPQVATLVELLQVRANRLADKPCLRYLADGEEEQDRLTYEQLDLRARSFASRLTSVAAPGDRAVLVYPPGADFLVAFFGCVYAGVIAVPVAPPLDGATALRLAGVVDDSQPSCVLTDASLADLLRGDGDATRPAVLDIGAGAGVEVVEWCPGHTDPDQVAMLQYTSGSTRVPRGVMVTHANLLSNLQWLKAGMRLPEEPTIVSWLPAYHDMGLIGSLFQTLYNGGDCVLMSPLDFLAKPIRWLKAIADYHAFGSGSPPFGYELAARKATAADLETLDLRDWRVACVTAEPIRAAGLRRFAETFAQCGFRPESFYPCYGLAETTLMVTGARARVKPQELHVRESALERGAAVRAPERGPDTVSLVSCGTARPGERVAIVDPETCSERTNGQVGEIWVNGPNVTRGYWGRPEETRSIFHAHLDDGSGPFLRTGDLGFLLGGQLYVTGRLKDVLIVRGRNLYPHDIEWSAQAADRRLRPGCGAAFTVGDPDDPSIVLVNEISEPDTAEDVATAVGRSIGETCGHPVRLVLIPARTIPKTSSGKVQHSRCRAMYLANELPIVWSSEQALLPRHGAAGDGGAAAPRDRADDGQDPPVLSELRHLVAGALAMRPDLLDLDIPLNRLGLDSLRALQIKETLLLSNAIEVPLRDLLGESSVRELSRQLAIPNRADNVEPVTVAADAEAADFALTDLQEAYCLGRSSDFELGNVGAHVYLEVEGHGLDTARMESAWRRLIGHHDALRVVVSSNATQRVERRCPPWHLAVRDLRGLTAVESATALEASRRELSHHVFPLDNWPMFEVRAHRLDGDVLRVQLSADLLAIDAASLLVIVEEWGRLYRDPNAELPPEAGYRAPIEARAALRDSPRYQRALSYWRDRVADLPYAPCLPTSPHRDTSTSPRFVRHSSSLSRDKWQSFTALAAKAGITPSTALLGAYAEVLATWAEDPRFTVSVTMRQGLPAAGSENLIGPFSDFMPAGIDWSPSGSFAQRTQRLRDQLFDDLDHREVGGIQVLREFARNKAISPAEAKVPVVFTPVLRELSVFDWLGEPICGVSQTPQVCLDNQSFLRDGGLAFHWDAVDDFFAPGVVEDMFAAYHNLLDQLAVDESTWNRTKQFNLVPDRQRRLRSQINSTTIPIPDLRLEDLFTRQCQRDPDRVAVICGARSFTYGDVTHKASALAGWLQAQGTQPGDRVAVVTEKGWEQAVSILAILMCGAAYVPLSPEVPAARLALLLRDCRATVVLTQGRLHQRIAWPAGPRIVAVDAMDLAAMPAAPSSSRFSPDDLCCLLYTSGSTGTPKGVRIHHRGLVNAVLDTNRTFGVGDDDRVLAVTDLHHDMSAYDIFGMFAAGGAIVIVPPGFRREPAAWIDLVARHRVSVWNSVPATMQMLIERADAVDDALPESLRLVFLGGDWIPIDLPARIRRRATKAEIVSVGGPTETTLWNIRYRIGEEPPGRTSIPYGTPIANTHYYVMDEALRDRPDWVVGELCSAGAGTSSGYLGDPQLTAAKFVSHPQTNETLCRTGDFGRWLPDGNIEFVGRLDGQIQIDGRRVESREIEAVLCRHPDVQSCVVTADSHGHGRRRLVAHVVSIDPTAAESSALDAYLRTQLPTHMLPGRFHFVDSIPLTGNGKADRRALAAAVAAEPAQLPASPHDNRGAVEKVASIVAAVLGRGTVPLDSALEDLGVGSLEMVRIANALEDAFGSRPNVETLFRASTIEAVGQLFALPAATAPKPGGEQVVQAAPGRVDDSRYTILTDPQARSAFRSQRHGRRRDLAADHQIEPLPSDRQPRLTARSSSRAFAQHATTKAALGDLLSVLRDLDPQGAVRRHAYGSGGGTYAVQTYLHVKPGRVEGLAGGVYYYDPHDHALVFLSPDAQRFTEDLHWWWNRATVQQSAFSVFLIAQLDAIGPLYGERALHFTTIEAGLMTQLLETTAPQCGLGLCQIGDLEFSKVRNLFALNDGHVLVHSLVGGPIAAPACHRDGAERERRVDGADLDDALRQPASTVNVSELRSRASLDSTIRPGSCSGGDDGRPVLLTGATGFLGAFVLRELLARGQKVVCLVRSNDSDAAEARLQCAADRLGIIWPAPDSVTALTGDTSKPRLGLSQKEFERLAASVGGIYHCAAPVSWVKSYAALEPAVVGSAREMLRLAVLNGGKPLHYVSSLAVFPFDGTARPEDHHSLDHGMSLLGGYAQAKWVGERLMAEGARRGLPVTIYRPPLISGHSRTGVFNADSYFERMIKGCIELGEAPQLDGVVDVAPVDYVAAALIDIATQRSSAGQVYHLNNPHPMAFSAFVDWIRGRGYPLVSVPFARWQQRLLSRNAFGDNALDPLTAHLKHASSGTMTTAVHDCRNAMAALSASGLRCPALGAELLSVYFEAFENSGYLGPLLEIGSPRRLA